MGILPWNVLLRCGETCFLGNLFDLAEDGREPEDGAVRGVQPAHPWEEVSGPVHVVAADDVSIPVQGLVPVRSAGGAGEDAADGAVLLAFRGRWFPVVAGVPADVIIFWIVID